MTYMTLFASIVSVNSTLHRKYNFSFFFFFQAEDGIRDKLVTGVQTCALPISRRPVPGVELLREVAPGPRDAPRGARPRHARRARDGTAARPELAGAGAQGQ